MVWTSQITLALIMSPNEIIIPLFGFNVGLEIGQFLIVFIVLISYVFCFLKVSITVGTYLSLVQHLASR